MTAFAQFAGLHWIIDHLRSHMRMAVVATGAEADIFEPFVMYTFFEGIQNILVTDAAGFRQIIPINPALAIRLP
jgi:hypothetical protein